MIIDLRKHVIDVFFTSIKLISIFCVRFGSHLKMAENEDLGIGNDENLDSLEETNGYNGTMGSMNESDLLNSVDGHDTEIENIKARVREMEEEAEKLKQLQSEVDKRMVTDNTSGDYLFLFLFRSDD